MKNKNASKFINNWVIEEWNKTDKLRVYRDEKGKIMMSMRLWSYGITSVANNL